MPARRSTVLLRNTTPTIAQGGSETLTINLERGEVVRSIEVSSGTIMRIHIQAQVQDSSQVNFNIKEWNGFCYAPAGGNLMPFKWEGLFMFPDFIRANPTLITRFIVEVENESSTISSANVNILVER